MPPRKKVNITNIASLESTLSLIGYEKYKRDSANRLIVYVEGDRKQQLKSIAEELDGTYLSQKTGSGWKSSVGAVKKNNFIILAKPSVDGVSGSLSSLDARAFSGKGSKSTFSYNGVNVPVMTFTSAKSIQDSIVGGCRSSNLLGDGVADSVADFFTTDTISWDPNIKLPVVNKLGVYIGEVLVGWVFLSKKQSKYFTTNPFKGTPKKFHLPIDPAFTGVDSWIEMSDGSFYSLSSKFGGGAKASIFTNLLEKGITKESKLRQSEFKKLCQTCVKNNIPYTKSKDIVYTHGVREILGLSEREIKNPLSVYQQIVSNKHESEAKKVIAIIKNDPKADDVVKKNLPYSVSAYFNRSIADRLNKDSASINQMKEILQGKDYWQGNLNISKWTKGKVEYKWLSSADAELNIIGSKGSTSDITSKQGWINYELTYK